MGKNQEYAQQYAEYAMEQMRRYGIPASVTLAQGILESSNGQSRLARNENNHFGIKASPLWVAGGGKYGIYTDDKPDEKFCSYDSVGDSYEHHSRFLKENDRYAGCFKLSPDDYKGWAQSIEKAGYATGGKYAENLQKIIEQNGLQQYDRQVMQEMAAQGRQFGVEHNPLQASEGAEHGMGYSFPVEREEFLFITSPFGTRQDPLDGTKQQMHKGVDIRCKDDAVLATENGGKVVTVNRNRNTPGGKGGCQPASRERETERTGRVSGRVTRGRIQRRYAAIKSDIKKDMERTAQESAPYLFYKIIKKNYPSNPKISLTSHSDISKFIYGILEKNDIVSCVGNIGENERTLAASYSSLDIGIDLLLI